MRARRESLGTVGTEGQWAIARSFMMLCFAAAGLLVLTYQPSRSRSPRAAHRSSAPQPSATVSPLPPVSPSGDLPSRPGGWQPGAIAPIVPVAPQAAMPPASQTGSTPSPQPAPAAVPSPTPPSPSSRPAPSPLSAASQSPALVRVGSASRSGSLAQEQAVSASSRNSNRSAPERAISAEIASRIAALATGILPPTPSQAAPRVQSRPAADSPPLQASGFVPVQSAHKVLTTLPLHTPRLVVDLSDRQVYFYHGDQIKASYPVAIGQDGWETPQGTFRVIDRQTYPLWEHPITKELIGNDLRNPLGTRWISFWTDGVHSIGFHGTNRDDSVGQAVSHGCLRMRNADIEALYDSVALGTPVLVRE
ncbi:L,D-transpeptidase [Thermoleptolyngbya sp. PKUAC-SCTB121]|uniref:L,D-transpeptidase n=1 Tax=Thermoleptolyngbya sp. PKUAC-SCTB121 TaxID=2811482 RepID=UPI001CEC3573|nr:L,D-transpeptidase [Thermoleptolyngbya sp. PKUAC-SCTB121]